MKYVIEPDFLNIVQLVIVLIKKSNNFYWPKTGSELNLIRNLLL